MLECSIEEGLVTSALWSRDQDSNDQVSIMEHTMKTGIAPLHSVGPTL